MQLKNNDYGNRKVKGVIGFVHCGQWKSTANLMEIIVLIVLLIGEIRAYSCVKTKDLQMTKIKGLVP